MLSSKPPVLQVAEAITVCNTLLKELPFCIEGEVGGYSLSRGQFVFFDLKDEQVEARLACFMMAHQLSVPLEDGMRVLVYGTPSIYTKSGALRITVARVELRGEGSLRRAFTLLQAKLEAEGLFATNRKRALPKLVEQVGIISSKEAAGFGDFMKIARERLPGIHFYFVNVAVQGSSAETEVVQAFDFLNTRTLDAIVLVRGGGSLEDLHAFNAERVARAIARSKAPVLVGVGHERDLTIADLVADVRAATPTNAAQLLLPTVQDVLSEVNTLLQTGQRTIASRIARQQAEVSYRLAGLTTRLRTQITSYRQVVDRRLTSINALSPQATLARGYTITSIDGQVLRSAQQVKTGQELKTQLAEGTIYSNAH